MLELQRVHFILRKSKPDFFEWLKDITPDNQIIQGRITYIVNMPLVLQNDTMMQILSDDGNLYNFVVWLPYVIGIKGQDYLYNDTHIDRKQFAALPLSERIEVIRQHASLNETRLTEFRSLPLEKTMPLISYFFAEIEKINTILKNHKGGGTGSLKNILQRQRAVKHVLAKYLGVSIDHVDVMGLEKFTMEYDRMLIENADRERREKAGTRCH